MANQIQITLRQVQRSDALEARIRSGVRKLERLYGGILSSRIVVESPHNHHSQGRHFVVRLEIRVPGEQIVVNHEHHEDAYVALRQAFDAAARQVEEFARRRRQGRQAGAGAHRAEESV